MPANGRWNLIRRLKVKPLCSANRVGCYTVINLKRHVSLIRAPIQISEASRNVMAELKMGRS